MTETPVTRRNFSISRSGKFKRRSKDRVSITDQSWITPDLDYEFEKIIVSLEFKEVTLKWHFDEFSSRNYLNFIRVPLENFPVLLFRLGNICGM